jgi:hypothetical protein
MTPLVSIASLKNNRFYNTIQWQLYTDLIFSSQGMPTVGFQVAAVMETEIVMNSGHW